MWYFWKKKSINSCFIFPFSYYKAKETSRNPYFPHVFQEENFRIYYPGTPEQLQIPFSIIYMHNVCSAERKKPFSCVLSEELWNNRTTWVLQGAPCWSSSVNPVGPHQGENNFDTTMKTSPSILRFSKTLSSNILFLFLPFTSIFQYGIGLRCCCLYMKNIAL